MTAGCALRSDRGPAHLHGCRHSNGNMACVGESVLSTTARTEPGQCPEMTSQRVLMTIVTGLVGRAGWRHGGGMPMVDDSLLAPMNGIGSSNTARSYRTAMRYWAAWFSLRYGARLTLPLPAPAVSQFIRDHVERVPPHRHSTELPVEMDIALVEAGFKAATGAPALSTLLHRVSVLSRSHREISLENPCLDVEVRKLLVEVRREAMQKSKNKSVGRASANVSFLER